jgi:hypothetical protein
VSVPSTTTQTQRDPFHSTELQLTHRATESIYFWIPNYATHWSSHCGTLQRTYVESFEKAHNATFLPASFNPNYSAHNTAEDEPVLATNSSTPASSNHLPNQASEYPSDNATNDLTN